MHERILLFVLPVLAKTAVTDRLPRDAVVQNQTSLKLIFWNVSETRSAFSDSDERDQPAEAGFYSVEVEI